jgi:predicted dehydrogenase
MEPVRWGVLGAAKIAVEKVIPAMQRGERCEIRALASRDPKQAERVARDLSIPRWYGSYEELLADPEIEAVYNPLPNHLHVPYSVMALRAGKHVLCEKPLALSAVEAMELVQVRNETGFLVQEAFMVHSHPQWLRLRDLVRSGRIGELRAIQGAFSFFNIDAGNVRNVPEYGGGGLMDIGCYPITTSRFVLGTEPERVFGLIENDPRFGVDRLTSAILDFGGVQSSFFCSTQLVPYQRMQFFGTTGRIEVEIPFNAPTDRPCRLFVSEGDLLGRDVEVVEIPACDQYTIQGDLFSECVRAGEDPPVTLKDSIRNMAVIDAVFRSAKSGLWEAPARFRF